MKAPWWPKAPFTAGHEASGVIVELGPDLVREELKVGQRVAMNFRTYCGKCYYCKSAREHMCEHVTNYEAGFAEYAVYGEAAVYPLPDDVSLEHGAFLEPVDHRHSRRGPGQHHPGPHRGHLRRRHHRLPGAADRHAGRSRPRAGVRPHAREAGAGHEAGRRLGRRPARTRTWRSPRGGYTDGRGFDTVFECSGRLAVAKECVRLADKCGTIVWAGVYPEEAEFPFNPYYLFANELTVRSTTLAPYVFPRAVKLLSKLDLDPLISEIVPARRHRPGPGRPEDQHGRQDPDQALAPSQLIGRSKRGRPK